MRPLLPLLLSLSVACGGAGDDDAVDGDGGPGDGDGNTTPGLDAQSGTPSDLEVADGCPGVFNPDQILDYHLDVAPGDWQTIVGDTTYSTVVEARLACANEVPITVGLRRKRSGGLQKVGLKIDINAFVTGQRYYGLRKLSLENGVSSGDNTDSSAARDVVGEYLGWRLMQRSGAVSGRAAFANVFVNGERIGVYVNVEQVDKTFLKDRLGDDTGWLYKKSGGTGDGLKTHETDGLDNPYDDYFCFWLSGGTACATPSAAELAAELPSHLDIDQMLLMGAVNGLMENADAPIIKDNNYYWYDWSGGRLYLPWDLDTTMKNAVDPFASSRYTDVLFTNWRDDYEALLLDLAQTRLTVDVIHAELDRAEAVAGAAIGSDPYISGSASGAVTTLKSYWTNRNAEVLQLLAP